MMERDVISHHAPLYGRATASGCVHTPYALLDYLLTDRLMSVLPSIPQPVVCQRI
jgi:hypothetical protein